LTDDEVVRIREMIDRDYRVEGDLRREQAMNVKRLMDLGCYRGCVTAQVAGARTADSHQRADPQGPVRPIARRRSNRESGRQRRTEQRRKRKDHGEGNCGASAPPRTQEHHVGLAHVNASFNNTIINITDAQGNTIACRRPSHVVQGFAQVDPVCRPRSRPTMQRARPWNMA